MDFYAQLYSLNKETEKDFFGTLEKVAAIGYKGVEFAGYGGIAAADMDKKLKELNLTAPASHTSLENLRDNLDQEIEYLKTVGGKYLVLAWADPKTAGGAAELGRELEQIAVKCGQAGLRLAYHNHAQEFAMDNGNYLLDIILDNAPHLALELDLFWITYAGVEAVEYISGRKDVCLLLHFKDMDNTESRNSVDVGTGVIDFAAAAQRAVNCEYYIYEQEHFAVSQLASAQNSYDNFMKMPFISV